MEITLKMVFIIAIIGTIYSFVNYWILMAIHSRLTKLMNRKNRR